MPGRTLRLVLGLAMLLVAGCGEKAPTHVVLPCADVQARKEAAINAIHERWRERRSEIDLNYASNRATGGLNHLRDLNELRRQIYQQLEQTEAKFNAECPTANK